MWLDEVGAATRLKLVANSWITALNVAVGETVALAEALDVAPETFLEAVRGGLADSAYLHLKARAIIDDDYTPSFSVALAGKDARLIKEAGEAAACGWTWRRRRPSDSPARPNSGTARTTWRPRTSPASTATPIGGDA